jgi:hypothetical protein
LCFSRCRARAATPSLVTLREMNMSAMGQTSPMTLVVLIHLATELSKFGQHTASPATLTRLRFVSFEVVSFGRVADGSAIPSWNMTKSLVIATAYNLKLVHVGGLIRAPAPVGPAVITNQRKEGHREHVDQTPEQNRLSAERH